MLSLIRLELPLPPSKNRAHVTGRAYVGKDGKPKSGGRHLSPEAKAFEAEVWAMVRQQTTPEQRELSGLYTVYAWVRFPENGRKHDSANVVDQLSDALETAFDYDDCNFVEWHIIPHGVEGLPCCEVLMVPRGAK